MLFRSFNSGAEAVENAVKIARNFTKRQAVVVFEHGYHGRTNLTMAMTAKNMPYKDGFGPFTPEVYRMPMSYPYRCDSCSGSCQESVLDTVLHKIEKEIGAKNVACIVIEPILGEISSNSWKTEAGLRSLDIASLSVVLVCMPPPASFSMIWACLPLTNCLC